MYVHYVYTDMHYVYTDVHYVYTDVHYICTDMQYVYTDVLYVYTDIHSVSIPSVYLVSDPAGSDNYDPLDHLSLVWNTVQSRSRRPLTREAQTRSQKKKIETAFITWSSASGRLRRADKKIS